RHSVSALIREGLAWRITEGDSRWQRTPGQRSAGHAALEALAQPSRLSEEGMPCDADLAGASQAAGHQTVGETWSRQAIVALILRRRTEGRTKTAIATRLNAAHVPLLAGQGRWNLRKVNRALWDVLKSQRERHAFLAHYAPTTASALGREGEHTGAS